MIEYHGLEWTQGTLPTTAQTWPRDDGYELAPDALQGWAAGRSLEWPEHTIYFFCDLHADPEACLTSLVASGGVARTGPGLADFELTAAGREAVFVIGGDCFDKGPDTLGLLGVLHRLRVVGARVEILAGNHDLRTLIGLVCLGRREPRLAHMFARVGGKAFALFRSVHERYPGKVPAGVSDAEASAVLYPKATWYEAFPAAVAGQLPPRRVEKEVVRLREKVSELQESCRAAGMSAGQLLAAAQKTRELLLVGEWSWFFREARLAHREGSFLFLHAGVDDEVCALLEEGGVDLLNRRFRELLDSAFGGGPAGLDPHEVLFDLYHGPVGNTLRTKYRAAVDRPLTGAGVAALRRAGIQVLVHGHRPLRRGQRLVLREGLLHVECDASVDRGTRARVGLDGPGGAVFILRGRSAGSDLLGVSTDCPCIKLLDPDSLGG